MTPARAAWIFANRKPGEHGDQGKEALPWWSFALFGGLASVWLLTSTLGVWLGLPAGEDHGEAAPGGLKDTLLTWGIYLVLFLPGAVAGGALGWFIIRPVNWALGVSSAASTGSLIGRRKPMARPLAGACVSARSCS